MKFEQNGLGFQNLYNIPQGAEVPWLTHQQHRQDGFHAEVAS